jgi:hypothetical protein
VARATHLPGAPHDRFLVVIQVLKVLSHELRVFHGDKAADIGISEYVHYLCELIHVLAERLFSLLDDFTIHVLDLLGWEFGQQSESCSPRLSLPLLNCLMERIELAIALFYVPGNKLRLHLQGICCVLARSL